MAKSPERQADSLWFAEKLPDIVKDKSLLEIGTGTGIISICCARKGAQVVGTDINKAAVANAKDNFNLVLPLQHGASLKVGEGDVYDAVKKNEKFDFIFWAHPFNYSRTKVTDLLEMSGKDYQYEGIDKYFAGARKHLKDTGVLLLGTGNTASLEEIVKIAEKYSYKFKSKPLAQKWLPLANNSEVIVQYLIYQFTPVERSWTYRVIKLFSVQSGGQNLKTDK